MNLLLFKIANGFMVGRPTLGAREFPESLKFLVPIIDALNAILVPLLILVAAAGTIYAVVLGVNMAKAETAEKREEAKRRIINAILALVITVVLILLLTLFVSNLENWFGEEVIVLEP